MSEMIQPPPYDYNTIIPIKEIKNMVLKAGKDKGLSEEKLKLEPYCILALSPPMLNTLLDLTKADEIPWLYHAKPMYRASINARKFNLIWGGPCGPICAYVMEQMISMGSKYFIAVGGAGEIRENSDSRYIVLPNSAVRDEGTSHQYFPDDVEVTPSEYIYNHLRGECKKYGVDAIEGPIWTTDGALRETETKKKDMAEKGVLAVDMETSVVFSIAKYRNVDAACIILIGPNMQRKGDKGHSLQVCEIAINTILSIT